MNEEITIQEAKELFLLCEEKKIEMPYSEYQESEKHQEGGYNSEWIIDGTYPLYTTNKLLDWLPDYIDGGYVLGLRKGNDIYWAEIDRAFKAPIARTTAKTPQSALVKLLIELIKKDLIK